MDKLGLNSTTIWVSGFVFVVSYLSWLLWNAYQFFNKQGLKGPRPLPLVGNMLEMFRAEQGAVQKRWREKYGKLYGVFFGVKPRLYVADADLVMRICIKDFDAFPNHGTFTIQGEYQKRFLIFLQDDHWRKVRALMTPTFTSSKIRRMFRLLDSCADDLVNCFNDQLNSQLSGHADGTSAIVNAKETYSLYTTDAIATCCYGLKLHRAGAIKLETIASRDDFVRECLKMFKVNKLKLILQAILPKNIIQRYGSTIFPSREFDQVAKFAQKVIDGRRKSGKKFDDYLQLLLDTKLDDEVEVENMDLQENHHANLSEEHIKESQRLLVERVTNGLASGQKVTLSDIEILSGAIFLLIVGLETTGNLLSNCTYLLGFHQDIQEKLYQEVKKIANFNEDKTKYVFSYDDLTSCQYLDAVISETLRFIPVVAAIDRVASRDYHIDKYNYTVSKDCNLILAFHSILHDPEYWPEPEKFDPERFMPGNKEKIYPGSYCPFGLGPRHCLGMRFSLTESKLALAKIIMSYRMSPAPGTVFPPPMVGPVGLNLLKNPLVKIEPRLVEFY